jgi:hypothetical protein
MKSAKSVKKVVVPDHMSDPDLLIMKKSIFSLWIVLAFFGCNTRMTQEILVQVDASKIQHTMKGGMGASWHAISTDLPLNNEKYTIKARETGSVRGSAWGGNPPVSNTKAWDQLKEHASWLGMNFIRVELSQRMYEPDKGRFDWENDEMLALYNILDWAQENNADVFLQQMWAYVEWNAIPDIHPLISAPKNLDDYAHGIATLLEYLIRERGYTCIKYFCMTNEPPGGTWGYWWEYGDTPGSITDAWQRLKEEFDHRQINIPISGPDWTDMPPFEPEKLGFAEYLGAIDIHSYHGVTPNGEENLRKWAEWAHQKGKPFFLSEYGNMNLGWGSNACDVLRGLHAGVDAFNRWSYTNRGDLDGQWQLIRTYDPESGEYLQEVIPEPEAYYGFAIISRFLSKYSSTVACEVSIPDSILLSAALLSPSGKLNLILVNQEDEPLTVKIGLSSYASKTMNVYQVTKESVASPGFRLNPVDSFNSSDKKKLVIPAESITTISSYQLRHED